METQTDDLEVETGAKTVLGLRVTPQLKQELSIEAGKLGISLSERGEDILLNRNLISAQLDRTKQELETEKGKGNALKQELERSKGNHFEAISAHKDELSKLQQQVAELNAGAELLKDERLLHLFAIVKGRKDEVENTNGKNFAITYNSPKDLLIAMIYSFELKKP
jgi:predicted nuclease with TOPRIM domain